MRGARAGEEVRVTRRDDAVDQQLARPTVVGVQPVALPRVVAQHHVRTGGPDHAHTVRRSRVGLSSPSTAPRKWTSAAPRVRAAARCSSLRAATSAARSWSGSQVPFEPSVSTSISTWAPGAPTARARPAPELDVVGMGADREHARGARCRWGPVAADSAVAGQRHEIVGDVDVEREVGVAHHAQPQPEPACFRGVAAERAWSVGEAEVAAVGTESTGVPSSRWQGTRATIGCAPSCASRASRARAGDRRARRPRAAPAAAEVVATGCGRAVERSRVVEHVEREVARPGTHVGIRGHHDDGHRRRGVHHLLGPPATSAARSAPSSEAARRALPSAKARIGITAPDAGAREASGNIAPRMLPIVGSPTSVAVIGAGSWGTTVAAIMSEHAPTTLWGRNPELVAEIAERHTNSRYLAGSRCRTPARHHRPRGRVHRRDVVVMAVPSHGYRAVLERAAPASVATCRW